MTQSKLIDVWRTNWGWAFVLLGLFVGLMVWALGLGRGFDQGLDQGIQAMETGQVILHSTDGGFEDYFLLRSLVEGMPGVESTSARLDFHAKVTNPQGVVKTVTLRAVNFAQENKVTSFKSRVNHSVSGAISGLIIPRSWEDQSYLYPSEQADLSSPDGTWEVKVAVSGSSERNSVLLGRDTALIDLETVQAFMGSRALPTSVAIKLAPGIDAATWIGDQRDAFKGYGVDIKSWKEESLELRTRLTAEAFPLFLFRDLVVLISAFLALALLLFWKKRGPRFVNQGAGIAGFPLFGSAVALVVVLLTIWISRMLFPFWENLVVDSFRRDYPFSGPAEMLWGWGWESLIVPGATLLAALVLVPRYRRRVNTRIEGQS